MASFRRLRTLFSATSLPKPTSATATASDNLVSIANKFKRASRSPRFRHHRSSVYTSTVRRLAAANQFSLVEDVIESQKQYPEISSEGFAVRLLSLYGKSGMFGHARRLFDEMPELKCQRTVKSFNALLSACVQAKEFDKVSDIFASLPKELGIEPDLISYNTVVNAFCEMGLFDDAISLIGEMGKNGLEPDTITFNTLLEGFYGKGMFAEAEKVWEMMREKEVVPNSRSFNPKIRALVVGGRISEAIEVIEEMKKEGVKPDTFSFNSLVKGFCESGNMEEAKRWFGEMAENGCKPDRVTYIELGYFACKMGDYDYAFELCKEAINAKLVIHKTMAQLAVDGLVKESKLKEAKELVELGNSDNPYSCDLKLPKTK